MYNSLSPHQASGTKYRAVPQKLTSLRLTQEGNICVPSLKNLLASTLPFNWRYTIVLNISGAFMLNSCLVEKGGCGKMEFWLIILTEWKSFGAVLTAAQWNHLHHTRRSASASASASAPAPAPASASASMKPDLTEGKRVHHRRVEAREVGR